MVEDFVILGVIFGSRKERRNVVVLFSRVRGCRKGGKGMGGVFVKFRGDAGAWTQKSRVVADTTSRGTLFHSAIVRGKNYIFLYCVRW